MKADINTIARKCGVSKATVSRVFTGKAAVSTSAREKILRVARELNYTPQQVVAQENIAIIVYTLDNTESADGFYSLILINLIAEITRAGFLVNIIEAKDCDKIVGGYTKVGIVCLNESLAAQHIDKINNIRIPLIAINNPIPNSHIICVDYCKEIESAVKYLAEQ